jgi:LPS O-antigen subunit length determinant protein (WzzB/FepE family)
MLRSQWIAILTGFLAVALGVGYLVLVQLLDWRGEMLPAPIDVTDLSNFSGLSDLSALSKHLWI